jgi:hypothetical protein
MNADKHRQIVLAFYRVWNPDLHAEGCRQCKKLTLLSVLAEYFLKQA